MADTPKGNRGPIVPGARVRVRAGGARSARVLGVVVDDYDAEAGVSAGHEWAPVRRWAVATDDGTLVFVDDGAIEPVTPGEG
ncbi:hypothetical protein R1X32_01950 (plasmid) [Rhodococcus opacus]|uniref:DUF1918 domain-containing protein n=1 Tax=Rhodococcus opacus TaxID=37919 RepID=A0AAX3YUM2_RHOOP|nr:hypothetical protein [Rhodococcus opacus]MCZ4590378.1 hypothetical protein [Rhodococcus opacus]WKN61202.1 hypothetical protein HJ581_0047305 [Rhodococcus opacus]WLF51633.1 hypothetical protein Q5707_39665 [Rhodococcus opacus]WLF52570.1 hypothetical protein Q5707_45330 [Rhodococcus opacus]